MLQHGGAFVIYLIASNIQSKAGSTMIKLILQLSGQNIDWNYAFGRFFNL